MSDFNLSLNPEDPLIQHAFRGTSFAVVRLEELNEIVNLKADAVTCYRPANSQGVSNRSCCFCPTLFRHPNNLRSVKPQTDRSCRG